jgi:hypothetical protein
MRHSALDKNHPLSGSINPYTKCRPLFLMPRAASVCSMRRASGANRFVSLRNNRAATFIIWMRLSRSRKYGANRAALYRSVNQKENGSGLQINRLPS